MGFGQLFLPSVGVGLHKSEEAPCVVWDDYHIVTETKWPPFYRWHLFFKFIFLYEYITGDIYFSNSFSCMNIFIFWLKFYQSLFLMIQIIMVKIIMVWHWTCEGPILLIHICIIPCDMGGGGRYFPELVVTFSHVDGSFHLYRPR